MLRAGLGSKGFRLVRDLALAQRADHAPLDRQDAHPNIGGHDGSEHGPELEACSAAGEEMKQKPGSPHQKRVRDRDPDFLVGKQPRTPHHIINQPTGSQQNHAQDHRRALTDAGIFGLHEQPPVVIHQHK